MRKKQPESALDPISIRIIERMQENSDIGLAELAEATGTTPSSCWRRLDELRQRGVIRRSVAVVDPQAIGLAVNVFVQVTLEKQTEAALRVFQTRIARRPEVMECYLMSGDADYLLRVVVEDLAQYHRFVVDHLTTIPGVANLRSSFALEQVKYTTALPTGHLHAPAPEAVRPSKRGSAPRAR
ncbi:Lrp/AsnC family transcriptional regulator [Roseicella aerolata]|uniref:Lrp/AsnC family transcriptional regulator n=1 Tax=Roseicella aerolata TaxID=2883479 RepID=A0A9X1IEP2_9PROT|nr:Lrp/AsnC family transcriptional regulator [Roseicella aerolata]MCB4823037.1 Lrp/AsnC family transcriptional regulator [Roseicella aerolata]